MDLETTVSQGFDSFMKACFPEGGIPSEQRREMRRAFYGGCWFALCSKPEHIAQIGAECERFKDDVVAGKS